MTSIEFTHTVIGQVVTSLHDQNKVESSNAVFYVAFEYSILSKALLLLLLKVKCIVIILITESP